MLNILSGPPKDKSHDNDTAEMFCSLKGTKLICGGTTVGIVSRYLEVEPEIVWEGNSSRVPPWGKLPGIAMVTEGVITLEALLRRLKAADLRNTPNPIHTLDKLVEFLSCHDDIHIYTGRAGKKFSDEPDRAEIIFHLRKELEKHNKRVIIHPLSGEIDE